MENFVSSICLVYVMWWEKTFIYLQKLVINISDKYYKQKQ